MHKTRIQDSIDDLDKTKTLLAAALTLHEYPSEEPTVESLVESAAGLAENAVNRLRGR